MSLMRNYYEDQGTQPFDENLSQDTKIAETSRPYRSEIENHE